ncbi:MAG TPA: hypothetical protein VKA15_21220 [Isosphaeraceae bacterium]|nr:hypothetical protein [Isosphaeraceae bacterium]
MNTLKLLNLVPTLTMVAVMAYAAYSTNPRVPSPLSTATASPAPAVWNGDMPDTGAGSRSEASTAADLIRGRNPFVVLVKSILGDKAMGDLATSQNAQVDPYVALVQGLALNATFVQDTTQYASINGRLYQRGQQLDGPNDEASPLIVAQVTPAQVTLEANGHRYTLAYPDQLTAAAGPRSTAAAGPRSTAAAVRRGGRPSPSGRSALPRR